MAEEVVVMRVEVKMTSEVVMVITLSPYLAAGTALSTLHSLSHLIISAALVISMLQMGA